MTSHILVNCCLWNLEGFWSLILRSDSPGDCASQEAAYDAGRVWPEMSNFPSLRQSIWKKITISWQPANLQAVTHWVSLISCWRGTNSSQWRLSFVAITPWPRYLGKKILNIYANVGQIWSKNWANIGQILSNYWVNIGKVLGKFGWIFGNNEMEWRQNWTLLCSLVHKLSPICARVSEALKDFFFFLKKICETSTCWQMCLWTKLRPTCRPGPSRCPRILSMIWS